MTIYNVIGPILLVVLVAGAVYLHRVPKKPNNH